MDSSCLNEANLCEGSFAALVSTGVGVGAGQCIDQLHYATFTISLICGDTVLLQPGSQAGTESEDGGGKWE